LRVLLNTRKLSKKEAPPTELKSLKGKDHSLADEIMKLANLHKEGLLTLEEFKESKLKLLK